MAAVAHRDAWTDPDDLAGIRLGLASQRLGPDYAVLVEHGEWRALDLLAEGPFRRRRRELKEAMDRLRIEGPVAMVFGPAPLSDLAHATWPMHPDVRLVLHFTRDGRVRVRSHPDLPVAAALANRHGGGGHAHAAGARLLSGSWLRMALYRTLGPRDAAVQRFLRDAHAAAIGHPDAGRAAAGGGNGPAGEPAATAGAAGKRPDGRRAEARGSAPKDAGNRRGVARKGGEAVVRERGSKPPPGTGQGEGRAAEGPEPRRSDGQERLRGGRSRRDAAAGQDTALGDAGRVSEEE
jgi:hypothetical protein